MFDRKSKLFRRLRALRRRTRSVTPGQLALDLLSQAATGAVAIIPIAWAVGKIPPGDVVWEHLPWPAYVYVAAVVFVAIYRTFLVRRFRNNRLEKVEKDRPVILSSAVSQLNNLLQGSGDIPKWVDAAQAYRKILSAILTEVESLVVDTEGVYVEVNLIVPHPTDDTKLRCIERAKSRRDIPKDYPKRGMLAWRCMEDVQRQHDPDYEPERGQQYRSILCFPLYVRPRGTGDLVRVFGAVSIDHGVAYEFDGIEDELENRVLPYLRLLEHIFLMQDARQIRNT